MRDIAKTALERERERERKEKKANGGRSRGRNNEKREGRSQNHISQTGKEG